LSNVDRANLKGHADGALVDASGIRLAPWISKVPLWVIYQNYVPGFGIASDNRISVGIECQLRDGEEGD